MKTWVKTSALGLIVAIVICLAARAQLNSLIQGTLTPAQDSIVQITADAMGLEPVAYADLPRGGTYWWVEPSGVMAPLPCPPQDRVVPIYAITDNQFLVDDTGGQVAVNTWILNLPQATTSSQTVSAVDRLGNAVADLIEQIQQTQFERNMMMSLGVPSPGEGGGGTNGGDYGNFSTFTFDKNLLWLEITNVSNGISLLNLHNATNRVYAIWTKTNLLSSWNVETVLWPKDPNFESFSLKNSDRPILFFRAEDWSTKDSDSDGIPDWWAWKYFGTINVTATNLDNYFRPLLYDYQHGQDPNQMGFSQVLAWGDNSFGQCDIPLNLTTAVAVAGNGDAYLTLMLGYSYIGGVFTFWPYIIATPTSGFSLALKADGGIVAWGDGRYGQTNIPGNLTNIMAVAAGSCHGLALDFSGNVQAWGSWNSAFVFTNDVVSNAAVVPIGVSNVVAIAAGRNHDVALRADGKVLSWGYFTNAAWVVVPTNLPPAKAVAAGWNYSAALLTNGTVAMWAGSFSAPTSSIAWYVPASLTNAIAIAGGPRDLLVLKADGNIIDLPGDSEIDSGQITTSVVSMANGYLPGLALDGSGTAWILGNSIATPNYSLSHLMSIAAGWNHALALRGGLLTALIVGQPASQFVTAGTNLTLSVQVLSNFTPSYQWQFNGVNLTGATNAVLTMANVQPSEDGDYACVVANDFGAVVSSNALIAVVTPPVITYQSQPTNIVCIYGNYVGFSATAFAPGQTNGFPISYRWQLNGTNIGVATSNSYSFFANDNNIGVYSLMASNIAGTASVSWHVTMPNAINITNDLLLIYNTNSQDSATVLNYYLAHRPGVSGVNVLGIGYTNPVSPGYDETITPTDLTNRILVPVSGWLAANPTKKPQYVVLMQDVPSRVYPVTSFPAGGFYPEDGLTEFPSVSVQILSITNNWQPFVTHLNMGDTNACIAYIKKVEYFGTNSSSPGSLVISASAREYGNTNYVVDNVRDSNYVSPFNGSIVSATIFGLTNAGVPSANIQYLNGVEVANSLPHLTSATNVAGYICWGMHSSLGGDYATNGVVIWSGNSGWWLIRTEESFNGHRYEVIFGTITKWFSSNAFGGTNYSNTPVGAVSYTDEPRANATDNAIYFGLWASGKNFAICAWNSKNTPYLQIVGDPFVTR